MKKIIVVVSLFCALLVCHAQEIYSKMDAKTLLNIMRNEGYSVSLDKDADIIWKKDGVKSAILFSNGNEAQTNFYFECGYELTPEKAAKAVYFCNEYNRKTRFGKAFVRKNSVVFHLALNLRNGVTKARIIDYLDDCQQFFKNWKKELVDKL